MIITIDGPAASGKSTAARLLAQRLGISFLDTGAMYRAVTLAAMRAGAELGDAGKVLEAMERTRFEFKIEEDVTRVFIDGQEVTKELREPMVTANAKYIASVGDLRGKLVEMQRRIAAEQGGIVTEGRDQGTVAFPNADVKFFLMADAAERARRRCEDLAAMGQREDVKKIEAAIRERDRSDLNREVGPLRPAADAIIIDTTKISVEEMVEELLRCVRERCSRKK